MGYYTLSETLDDCSESIIDGFMGAFIRNPILASAIVSFITLFICNSYKFKRMSRVFIVSTAINSLLLFIHAEGLLRYLRSKDKTSKITERFNYIQSTREEDVDEFLPDI